MFDRWLQENDFKYLDVHFGINQITSYQSESYEQLAGQLEDRQMKHAHYTVLADQCGKERKQLGKLLVQQRHAALNEKLKTTDQEVSRLETLIARGAVRLCGEKKYLMDVIKITARNLFYQVLAPFKKSYDNYRDDHVWFRQLTRSQGIIESVADGGQGPICCHLIGTAGYPKPVLKVAGQILAEFNATKLQWPDGSGRAFELLLGSKDAIQLAPSKP